MDDKIISTFRRSDPCIAQFICRGLGSVTYKIAETSKTPYIVCKSNYAGAPLRIIVPATLDTLADSQTARKIAQEHWETFKGFDLVYDQHFSARRGSWNPTLATIKKICKKSGADLFNGARVDMRITEDNPAYGWYFAE